MTTYLLTFDFADGTHGPLTIDGDEPAHLAQAVHRHARGYLGGSRVDIQLDTETYSGTVHNHGTPVGTLTLDAVAPTPEPVDTWTPSPYEIRYGYTLRDLDTMAAAACRADRSLASDARTRYDVAWSAIAEALVAAEEWPPREHLVRVGWQAIYNEVRQMRHLFGQRDKDGTNEVASSPRYRQYWYAPPVGHDEGLAERLAVGQILAVLPDVYRDAVVALAVHNDYQRAADALGIKYTALTARMTVARRTFRRHWFAPETPPPIKGTDRRIGTRGREKATHCGAGHEWTPENTRWDTGRGAGYAKVRTCRKCEARRDQEKRARKAVAA